MIGTKEAVAIHRAFSRVMAHLMGTKPEIVWATYRTFEDDINILVDIVGVLEDTAKPYLEERARKVRTAHGRPDGRAAAASSSRVVPVTETNILDGAVPEEVEPNLWVNREEGVHDLGDPEEPLVDP